MWARRRKAEYGAAPTNTPSERGSNKQDIITWNGTLDIVGSDKYLWRAQRDIDQEAGPSADPIAPASARVPQTTLSLR